jgi:UDP-N-acetylmuramate dehydrogenase
MTAHQAPCKATWNQKLAACSTWKMGGSARVLCEPSSVSELQAVEAWRKRHGLKRLIIGGGSNLLFSDDGFDGVVLRLADDFAEFALDGNRMRVGAAASAVKVARACAEAGLSGMEFAAGLPATVGGLVMMNAGAYGQDMQAVIERVQVLREGGLRWLDAKDLTFDYRHVTGLEMGIVLAAELRLEKQDTEKVQERTTRWLKERKQKQPLNKATCGSVFKRPEGDFPGRLIEAAGLKGHAVGAMRVSSLHANFFVNEGGAKAADALALVQLVKTSVRTKFGVELEEEFRYVS